jgi:hypothetical protein
MITKKLSDIIISLFYSLLIFIFSLWLIEFYQNGDQSHYINYWIEVKELGFLDTYTLLPILLGSAEPGYAFLVYVFSGLIEKEIVMSILNSLITYFLVMWILKKRVHFILIPFILLNFYILVLFFPAERLKLAFLFFLLAEYYKTYNILWYILALLSHVSIVLMIAVQYINSIFKIILKLLNGYVSKNTLYYLLLTIVVLIIMTSVLDEHIIRKLDYLKLELSLSGIIKMLIFIIMASFYSKNRFEPILAGLPLFIAASLLGPDRITMFGFFLFMYYGLQYKRGLNLGVFVVLLYFIIKSALFTTAVINHGDGFYFENKVQKEIE